jgi:hypothetical protein
MVELTIEETKKILFALRIAKNWLLVSTYSMDTRDKERAKEDLKEIESVIKDLEDLV